jgi:hypothetical protein
MTWKTEVLERVLRKYQAKKHVRIGVLRKRADGIIQCSVDYTERGRTRRKMHYFCHVNGQVRPYRKGCKRTRPYKTKTASRKTSKSRSKKGRSKTKTRGKGRKKTARKTRGRKTRVQRR